ncbi:YitT family protein [Granulicatella seriolae]|uniref:YitT family protein n=1 Tax=Granulicatella seriolae TaxID=2967226 RepID=A0ABT1WL16_9LACT|nr:YitT family protein [Granulicatella seriolae]
MSVLDVVNERRLRKHKKLRTMVTLLAITASGFLQAATLKMFIQPSNLLSSGFLGISILVNQIAKLSGITIPIAALMILINIPVAFICFKGISPRFTIFSILQVFISSFFISTLNFKPISDDIILNVIFGGVLNGLAVTMALKGNASTGGTDFIALYVSNKSGKTIWQQVFLFNIVLLLIFGALFGWEHAGYSIIFQYISTKVISTFHRRYQRVTLQITTKHADTVMDAYLKQIRHGISCVEAVGGYSHERMYLLHTVLSSYEVMDAVQVLKDADPHIIINQLSTINFYGRFYREPE